MKKIYTFTIDAEEYPSGNLNGPLRIFADLVYSILYNYYGEGITPLNISKNIVRNNINYSYEDKNYYLDSDKFDNGYIDYEPFIIGTKSFGLTIKDDMLSEKEILIIISQAFEMMKLNHMLKITSTVTIKSVPYSSIDEDDEKNRRKAISTAYNNLGYELPPRKIIHYFSRKKALNR